MPKSREFDLDIRLPVGLAAEEVMAAHYLAILTKLKRQEAASSSSNFSVIDHPLIENFRENANAFEGFHPMLIPSMGATDQLQASPLCW
ncbi:hypothetical protein N7454_004087 [Penicillium verhagenii]|nr:hypothetical protein N7454_004087 [Penicillium verhagenii]